MDTPVILIHAYLPAGAVDSSGQRAALGEGCLARDIVLSMLCMRYELLDLRAVSKACKQLVSEADLKSQAAAGQVPRIASRVGLDVFQRAFPNSATVQVANRGWTKDDLTAMAKFRGVKMDAIAEDSATSADVCDIGIPDALATKIVSGAFSLKNDEEHTCNMATLRNCTELSLQLLDRASRIPGILPPTLRRLTLSGSGVDAKLNAALELVLPSGGSDGTQCGRTVQTVQTAGGALVKRLQHLTLIGADAVVSPALCFQSLTTLSLVFTPGSLFDLGSLPPSLQHLSLRGCTLPSPALPQHEVKILSSRAAAMNAAQKAAAGLVGIYTDFSHLPRLQSVSLTDCSHINFGRLLAQLPATLTHITVKFTIKHEEWAEEGGEEAQRVLASKHFSLTSEDLLVLKGSSVTYLYLTAGPSAVGREVVSMDAVQALAGLTELHVQHGWIVLPDKDDLYDAWQGMRSLTLPARALTFRHLTRALPKLTHLTFGEGHTKWGPTQLHSFLLLKPSLQQLTFWADDIDAQSLCNAMFQALSQSHTPGLDPLHLQAPFRMWWRPDTRALRRHLKLPTLDDARGDVRDSDGGRWYVLNSTRLAMEALFSCTSHSSAMWSLRIQGRKAA